MPESAPWSSDEDLVVVQFKANRKSYYHNRRGVPVRVGQFCLVEADRGRDLGRVIYVGCGTVRWWKLAHRQGVLAVANDSDLKRLHENRSDETQCREICAEKVRARNLPMDLVGCERQWDRNKITFYFTAEGRVDFRQLVRDLASVFRTRIELRQIGVRDEARLKGGLGICGREFCCATFMHEFSTVTLRMAKDQQLPMNPSKLSGLCGRLRCCLSYEHDQYRTALADMPRVNTRVVWRDQPAKVRKLDLVKAEVTLFLLDDQDADPVTVPVAEVEWDRPDPAAGSGPPRDRARRDPQPGQSEGAAGDGQSEPARSGRRRTRRRGGRRRSPPGGGNGRSET